MLTSGTVTKGVAGFNSVVAPKKDQLEAMTPSDSPKKPSKNSEMDQLLPAHVANTIVWWQG